MNEFWSARKAAAWEAMKMALYAKGPPDMASPVAHKWDHGRETSHIVIDPRHDR